MLSYYLTNNQVSKISKYAFQLPFNLNTQTLVIQIVTQNRFSNIVNHKHE